MHCNPSGHPCCGILWDNQALLLPGGAGFAGSSCDPFSLQEKTSTERQKVLGVFEGLRLFLEEQEHHLLAQLENTERDVEKTQEENVTILTKEISHLDAIIQEMEEKCQQPASNFLQDIRSTLSRLGKEIFQQPTLLLPDLERNLNHFREKNNALEEILKNFKEILMFELPEKSKSIFWSRRD
ncbi:tripartite motif-containing protein 10-like [Meleagris gallopavo]|uniref:tripartite motif-containing protein 10-like n=1 Tax=Meleagris gallopavo TaxID=9103 RepID=UPI000549CA6C|nr:tripartite motif-containing protein 10-like [Meleagris gallopavo]XP_031413347.1 tripartite motif-containing protein 10-like [Meleagris gallopavo]